MKIPIDNDSKKFLLVLRLLRIQDEHILCQTQDHGSDASQHIQTPSHDHYFPAGKIREINKMLT